MLVACYAIDKYERRHGFIENYLTSFCLRHNRESRVLIVTNNWHLKCLVVAGILWIREKKGPPGFNRLFGKQRWCHDRFIPFIKVNRVCEKINF
jgi:hypothetical protein